MFRKVAAILVCGCAAMYAADPPEDPAVALARILAAKGTLEQADVVEVSTASAGQRVTVLAAVLQRRGVLTDSEVAQIWNPAGTASAPVMAVASRAPAPAPKPAAAPQTGSHREIPVVTEPPVGLTAYGTILWNAFYNTVPTNIQDIPLLANKKGSDPTGGDKNFGETARQTRIGLKLHANHVAGATLSGDFEFDLFAGKTPLTNGIDMDIFRLRLANGRLDWHHVAFEAGQDWVIFAPLNPTSLAGYAIPDFSASGNPWARLPQIRGEYFTAKEGSRLLWQVGALDPNMGDYPITPFSTSRQPGIGERGRMPALESRVAWTEHSHGRDYTIGLSGHYGRGKNAGLIDIIEAFRPVDSWGVALDYSLPFTKHFNLTGEAFEGRALGIFSETSGEAIGAVGTSGEHGVEVRGGWAQAQFNFAKVWQINLGYGLEVPNASQLPVGNRWRNQTYMGNVMYKLTPNITFALEYRRLLTDYRNQIFANNRGDHVNLAVAYFF